MVKLDEARITSQGQVSVPKRIREKLGLKKGDKIAFLEDDKGQIVIREAETPIEFTAEQWQEFLTKSEKEKVARVKGKGKALEHLDRLMK